MRVIQGHAEAVRVRLGPEDRGDGGDAVLRPAAGEARRLVAAEIPPEDRPVALGGPEVALLHADREGDRKGLVIGKADGGAAFVFRVFPDRLGGRVQRAGQDAGLARCQRRDHAAFVH